MAICVSSLQDVKLFNSNLDVVDEAFEYLMSKSQKGEKGQYFTPHWEEVLNDDDRKDIYYEGWKRFKNLCRVKNNNRDFNFDIVMANPPFAGDIKESKIIMKYDIAKKSEHSYQSKIGRDILFIEHNLQFLKPGGRMAIVIPQGRFNNSSDKYIRDFIAERCRILAVVGLHGNVFKPHTGTKTSVLFVQKWDDELCPYREDYPIFFATMQKPSKDNIRDC